MSWAAAAPNFVIGIREGLEAGLVVSILLAAVRRTGDEDATASTAPVWLGVLGAVAVAGSFAAVLTYSTSVLSSRGQDATGGLLGVLAVSLVTMMVFWMRRTAAGLSARLKGDVAEAVTMGAGALALTAFLSVGREGLETTLFLWTAVRASGQTASPLVGAGLGLAAAVALCWLLYRRALRLDLGAFFNRTALALLVVAAGVLSYALGELQDAGWLSGQQWTAFDLSAHLDPSSWWVSIVSGITDLSPRMSVLQVVTWVAYLVVVIPSFVRAGRTRPEPAPAAVAAPASSGVPARGPAATLATGNWWRRLAGRRLWATSAVLVAVPVAAAGLAIVALPSADAADSTAVTVTATSCAPEWTAAHTGPQRFSVTDESTRAGEINLVTASGGIAAEIETLGPSTTATMTATLGPGSYTIRCLLAGQPATSSNPVQVSGPADAPTVAVAPVTLGELTGPNDRYQAYAAGVLDALAADVVPLRRALQDGDLDAARADWLTAQLEWERVGASYDSFGALGVAVDGLPDGLPGGVHDPDFTGLHRLEYGLWHGQRPASLVPVAVRLAADIATIQRNLRTDAIAGDPTNLPIRAHEIMEDALRDHLSGIDDQGAGAAYAETAADVEVDRVVIGELAPLLRTRSPGLVPEIDRQLAALASSLAAAHAAGQWRAPAAVPLATRQPVDAAIGALLETLSSVPDLLEVPPTP